MTTKHASKPSALTLIVAEEVRALMGRHRVSQVRLSEVLGVAQTGISARLRGVTPFDVNEIGVLADFFHVPAATLVGGTGLIEPWPPTDRSTVLPRPDSNRKPADYTAERRRSSRSSFRRPMPIAA